MGRFVLSRRTMLMGMGAAIGLPTLEAMLNSNGDALAGGQPLPKRFLMWFFGNGVDPPRWVPADQGPDWTPSAELAPLATNPLVRSYCSVLSGFNSRAPQKITHHEGMIV